MSPWGNHAEEFLGRWSRIGDHTDEFEITETEIQLKYRHSEEVCDAKFDSTNCQIDVPSQNLAFRAAGYANGRKIVDVHRLGTPDMSIPTEGDRYQHEESL